MPPDSALTLSDVRERTLTIVCEPSGPHRMRSEAADVERADAVAARDGRLEVQLAAVGVDRGRSNDRPARDHLWANV
jgi:hypothetical protein